MRIANQPCFCAFLLGDSYTLADSFMPTSNIHEALRPPYRSLVKWKRLELNQQRLPHGNGFTDRCSTTNSYLFSVCISATNTLSGRYPEYLNVRTCTLLEPIFQESNLSCLYIARSPDIWNRTRLSTLPFNTYGCHQRLTFIYQHYHLQGFEHWSI